ncbi:nitrogen regulation protein NR(II) [Bacillus salitolerans]|uniref:histidine kinase n=1 Tax=Bacillus salitolerans TaxID=1437434 RepID=A0ABW4LSJ7_9BACI
MKDLNNQNIKQLTALEKELLAYRDLISKLSMGIQYENPELGIRINKDRGQVKTEVIHIQTRNQPSFCIQDLVIPRDTDFEEVEVLLSPILDTVPHHIVFCNNKGEITLINKKAASDLHVNRERMIGKHIRELLKIPDSLIMLLETIKTRKQIVNRDVLDSNYGINNTHIVWDQDGEIKRVIGTFEFLNVVKEAEKQAMAGRIAAGIAHEIRNPLTTVRGYLQFLLDKLSPEVSGIVSSLLIPELDRANKIISDFLSIAKPSETKFELVKINSYICDELGSFLKSEAFLHRVEIEFNCSLEVEDSLVSINHQEILQVFINLFRNALEAKNDNPLKISLETKREMNFVQIIFKDNGTGISPIHLEHIFDPFFTTKDEGTGLGLSVSRKMIENHGGSMLVSSSEDGTTFLINLPIANTMS